MAANYAGPGSGMAAAASATNGTLTGFPRLLVESGNDEAFQSQIEVFVAKVRAAGVQCEYNNIEGACHVSSIFFGTKAAASTISFLHIVEFLNSVLGPPNSDGAAHAPRTRSNLRLGTTIHPEIDHSVVKCDSHTAVEVGDSSSDA